MNHQYVKNVVEASLLAAGRPLTVEELMSVFDERDGSIADEVKTAIAALAAEYETRGLELLEVSSGFRIQIRAAVAQDGKPQATLASPAIRLVSQVPIPVAIRAGDQVTVDQETPSLRARLQAVALESGVVGQRVRVRLTAGTDAQLGLYGKVILAIATGVREAQWLGAEGSRP